MEKLEKLKENYRNFKPKEVRESLNLDLALMQLTGRLELRYALMLDVARENNLLDKTEINDYKIKGFNAVFDGLKPLEKVQ
jgi:hypothetical protein